MEVPPISYTRSGDVAIAYQVLGDGPVDLETLVSATVKDLVAGSGIEFESRGVRERKGLGEWPLYAVAP